MYLPLHYSKLPEDRVSLGGAEKLPDIFHEAVHGLHEISVAIPPCLQVSDRTDNDGVGIQSAELLDEEYRRGVGGRDVAGHESLQLLVLLLLRHVARGVEKRGPSTDDI